MLNTFLMQNRLKKYRLQDENKRSLSQKLISFNEEMSLINLTSQLFVSLL